MCSVFDVELALSSFIVLSVAIYHIYYIVYGTTSAYSSPIFAPVTDTYQNSYIPYTDETASPTSCGIPITFKAGQEFASKKAVLFAVPGAFTPGCSVRHLPGYIEKITEMRGKGVDLVCVVASNDAFVMSAWGKVNGIKDEIVSLPLSFCLGGLQACGVDM